MTDDKEERRTISEREIIDLVDSWTKPYAVPLGPSWFKRLPLASKHTDKPPYQMLKDLRCPSCGNSSIQDVACEECDKSVIADLEKIAALELRIKELESFRPICHGMMFSSDHTACSSCPFKKNCKKADSEMNAACGTEVTRK